MAIPKIKTNLFSFKTFRSPDKIDINEINNFFIQHPDITQSQFNFCLSAMKMEATKKNIMNF